jgi:hypothetical protein
MDSTSPSQGNIENKKCQFCAEEVKSDAKICKHCGKNLCFTPLSDSRKRSIKISHVVGTSLFYAVIFWLIGAAVGEFTSFYGGLAAIADPFSGPRNEVAVVYGIIAGIIGFAVVGPLAGSSSARKQISKLEGNS